MKELKIGGVAYVLHKVGEDYKGCHDRFCLNAEMRRFAIADGVSVSFFPAMWADLLVRDFCRHGFEDTFSRPSKRQEWLDRMLTRCMDSWYEKVRAFIDGGVPFYTRNKFNQRESAAATTVALEIDVRTNLCWRAFCLGDSYLLIFDEKYNLLETCSSHLAEEPFDNYPDYLDSYKGLAKGEPQWEEGSLKEGMIMLMVTDALAEWILTYKADPEILYQVFQIRHKSDFEKFVDTEKSNGRLKDDDITFVRINVEAEESDFDQDDILSLIEEEENKKIETSKKESIDTPEDLDGESGVISNEVVYSDGEAVDVKEKELDEKQSMTEKEKSKQSARSEAVEVKDDLDSSPKEASRVTAKSEEKNRSLSLSKLSQIIRSIFLVDEKEGITSIEEFEKNLYKLIEIEKIYQEKKDQLTIEEAKELFSKIFALLPNKD